MKKYYISFLILSLTLSLQSCNKFLDVKPIGKLIPEEVDDLDKLLNNTRTIDYHFLDNNRGNFYAFLGDNFTISENEAIYSYVSTHPNVERLAAYTFKRPYQNPRTMQYTWDWGIYRAVALFNQVVDGINDLPESKKDTEYARSVIAQAKAGRAWSYLVGTLGYGPMYNPDGPNDTKVLPYRTTASPDIPNPQLSTTEELFELILKDLNEAMDAPDNVANPTRANLTAVYALKANYYMYKRNWPLMLENAEEAWRRALALNGGNVDKLIYNLNDFSYIDNPSASPSPGTDVEVSLELKGPDALIKQTYNRENLLFRYSPYGYSPYPSEDFLSIFDENTDVRYQLFALKTLGYSTTVAGVLHDDGVRIKYYRESKTLGNAGLTYPELLLVKAEANARTGELGTALRDLNTLRKYRYSGADTDLPNGSSLSQDDLLNEILTERRRELPIGSFQRVFDLKRYAYDAGKPWSKSTITHYIGSKAYTAPVNDEYFTLPISNNIILLNPQWGLQISNEDYNPAL